MDPAPQDPNSPVRLHGPGRHGPVHRLVNAGADIRCGKCLRPATTITITPVLSFPTRRVYVTCSRHALRRHNQYSFDLASWFGAGYTMREHLLDAKVHGLRATRLIEQALARAVVPGEDAA